MERRGADRRHTGIALVAVAVLLALAPPAGAAVPRGGADYGGGMLVFGASPLGQGVALHASRTGRTLAFWGRLADPRCGREAVFTAQAVRVRRDGGFDGAGRYHVGANEETAEDGPFRFTGRFTGAGKAVGAARIQWVVKAPDRPLYCDSGTIRWQAVAPGVRGGSGVLRRSATYAGTTSQRSRRVPVKLPFVMRVARTGRQVALASASINLACRSDPPVSASVSGVFLEDRIPIRGRRRAFAETDSFSSDGGDQTIDYTTIIHGRFGTRAVSGTWRLIAVLRSKDGGMVVDHCDSGVQKWSAAR